MSWKYWLPDARDNGPVQWRTRTPARPKIQNNTPDGWLLVRLVKGDVSPRADAWLGGLAWFGFVFLLWSLAVMLGGE